MGAPTSQEDDARVPRAQRLRIDAPGEIANAARRGSQGRRVFGVLPMYPFYSFVLWACIVVSRAYDPDVDRGFPYLRLFAISFFVVITLDMLQWAAYLVQVRIGAFVDDEETGRR
ncbi:hypothetical protein GGR53DRAFT_467913 [Hypoxylon sp. FL1150]|nr:hypothetical protein GGR53DRAFT_467913 [Hypoxylon sp. FL1150]